MPRSHFFLASFVVAAFLGIVSADYSAGRSLKPYETNNNDYRAGRSLKPYQPYNYDYKAGRSLKPYTPYDYKVGRSLKPYQPQEQYPGYKQYDNPANINIQGLIYCKKNGQLIPMQGANARVTCEVKHKNGYETAHISHISVDTPVTDKNGYFLINLGKYFSPKYTFKNCKVFLDEAVHGEHCSIPTNVNNGISGATPAKPRRLSGNYVLYSVGPFAFVPASY